MQDVCHMNLVRYSGGSIPSDKEGGWGGGGHPDPKISGSPVSKKNCFSALRASVWSSPGSATEVVLSP